MSHEGRIAESRARRIFDRSIALARYRWEILRRTLAYRAAFFETGRSIAATLQQTESELYQYCQDHDGTLPSVFGEGFSSLEHYDEVCARFGLTSLLHPDISISDSEMAVFPIFADTPRRQPVLLNRLALRRARIWGATISLRTPRGIFGKRVVQAGAFQPKVKRIHLPRLAMRLAVFDARAAGKPLKRIAKELGLSVDQAKRAWRAMRVEIDHWVDIGTHVKDCPRCQASLQEHRGQYCPVFELQIGLRSARGVQLHARREQELDRLNARHQGGIPARRSFKFPSPAYD